MSVGTLVEQRFIRRVETKYSFDSLQSLLHLASAFLPKLGPFFFAHRWFRTLAERPLDQLHKEFKASASGISARTSESFCIRRKGGARTLRSTTLKSAGDLRLA